MLWLYLQSSAFGLRSVVLSPDEPEEGRGGGGGGDGERDAELHEGAEGDGVAVPAKVADGDDVGGGADGSDVSPDARGDEESEKQQHLVRPRGEVLCDGNHRHELGDVVD